MRNVSPIVKTLLNLDMKAQNLYKSIILATKMNVRLVSHSAVLSDVTQPRIMAAWLTPEV